MTLNEDICVCLDEIISNSYNLASLDLLDTISAQLAKNKDIREEIGDSSPSIWLAFHRAWKELVTREEHEDYDLNRSIVSIARFTRNLVAEVKTNQHNAFANEPCIRTLIHQRTAFLAIETSETYFATRVLLQTLSNLVTSNEYLIDQLWELYLSLPEESNILIRVLYHPDRLVITSALILILNCIHQHKDRISALVSSSIGGRICVALLDRIASSFEETDTEEKCFELLYQIFANIFDGLFTVTLFRRLSLEDEIVTPHQTNSLKVLDSYLLQLPEGIAMTRFDVVECIVPLFFRLCEYLRVAIRRFLNQEALSQDVTTQEAIHAPDIILPRVSEALVLATQCLCTITLSEGSLPHIDSVRSAKRFISEAYSSTNSNFIEMLIDTVRVLDEFVPRVTLGKITLQPGQTEPSNVDASGFNYLKRDLIRLLGILCFRNEFVQNKVRTSGGIPVVMNLCVIDERNPYIREHALFTLRNLLDGSVENQSLVDEIRPVLQWDENGLLRNISRVE